MDNYDDGEMNPKVEIERNKRKKIAEQLMAQMKKPDAQPDDEMAKAQTSMRKAFNY